MDSRHSPNNTELLHAHMNVHNAIFIHIQEAQGGWLCSDTESSKALWEAVIKCDKGKKCNVMYVVMISTSKDYAVTPHL